MPLTRIWNFTIKPSANTCPVCTKVLPKTVRIVPDQPPMGIGFFAWQACTERAGVQERGTLGTLHGSGKIDFVGNSNVLDFCVGYNY